MRLTIDRKQLIKALEITNHNSQYLKYGVLLRAKGIRLDVLTRGSVDIDISLSADVIEPGEALAPPQARRVLKQWSCQRVELVTEGEMLNIVGDGTASFFNKPVDPMFDMVDISKPLHTIAVGASEFFKSLAIVLPSASTDDANRPSMCCVENTITDGQWKMAATDGFTLAISTFKLKSVVYTPDKTTFLLHGASLKKLEKLGIPKDANILIVVGMYRTEFVIDMPLGRITFAVATDWSKFPAYQSVVPNSFQSELTVDSNLLQKQAAICRMFSGCMEMIILYDKLIIRSVSMDEKMLDVYVCEMPATSTGDLEISVDPKYILWMLAAMPKPGMFSFNGSYRSLAHVSEGLTLLAMPMQPREGKKK